MKKQEVFQAYLASYYLSSQFTNTAPNMIFKLRRPTRILLSILGGTLTACVLFLLIQAACILLFSRAEHGDKAAIVQEEQVLRKAMQRLLNHEIAGIKQRAEWLIKGGALFHLMQNSTREELVDELGKRLKGIDLSIIFDAEGRPIYLQDPTRLSSATLNDFRTYPLITEALQGRSKITYVPAMEGLLLAAAFPILPETSGELKGVLLLLQFFNQDRLLAFEQRIGARISLRDGIGNALPKVMKDGFFPPPFEASVQIGNSKWPITTNGSAHIPIVVKGIYDHPVGVFWVRQSIIKSVPFVDLISATFLKYLPVAAAISILLGLGIGYYLHRFFAYPLIRLMKSRQALQRIRSKRRAMVSDERFFETTLGVYRHELFRIIMGSDGVLDSISDGVMLVDFKGKVVGVNNGLCSLLGMSREELTKTSDPLFFLNDVERSRAHDALELLRIAQKPGKAGLEVKPFLEIVKGELQCILRLRSIDCGPHGERYFLIVLKARGIDGEQGELVTKEQAARVLADFSAGVASNINNLLTSVVGALSVISNNTGGNIELQSQMLKTIKQSVAQGTSLTKELLNIARFRSVKIPTVPLDLCKIVGDAVAKISSAEEAKSYKIVTESTEERTIVMAEEVGIHQVLTNLVSYSFSQMPNGGRVLIKIFHDPIDEGMVNLFVFDEGEGMTSEAIARVFEPFFGSRGSGSDSRRYLGSGLGMAATKALVESWGGSISCRSEIGRGTNFRVCLKQASSRDMVVGGKVIGQRAT